MKTLGLIGGMSWESTIPYYRIINEAVRERLGGLHSARLILYSVDFADIERWQQAAAWDEAGTLLAQAARSLEAAGAEGLALCTNTMHKVAPAIEAAVTIPLLHIADPTAVTVKQAGFHTVGLLGTRFTMEQDFYRSRLMERHGLTVIVPDLADRETVHRIIYEELCRGEVREDSRAQYRAILQRCMVAGAEGIILGCTEIGLLVKPADAPVPLFDTTYLHARSVAEWALADDPGCPSDAAPEAKRLLRACFGNGPRAMSACDLGGYAIVSAARPGLDEDDFWQAMIIAERCFQSAQDAFQMPIEESTIGWIRATIPAHWHLIQHQGKVIGSTLLMPTSSAVMAAFLAGALTEAGLFASARQTCPHSADCGYWAGTSVMETHRRRGLGLASLNAALQAFIAHEHPQPTFYYWSYSAAGQRLAQHWRPALAQQGLRLLERREPDSERHDRLSTQGCPDVE